MKINYMIISPFRVITQCSFKDAGLVANKASQTVTGLVAAVLPIMYI